MLKQHSDNRPKKRTGQFLPTNLSHTQMKGNLQVVIDHRLFPDPIQCRHRRFSSSEMDSTKLKQFLGNRQAKCSPRPGFKVAYCDLKPSCSSAVNRIMKSDGNLLKFLRTCSFSVLTVTP